jgi:hypothetical protein
MSPYEESSFGSCRQARQRFSAPAFSGQVDSLLRRRNIRWSLCGRLCPAQNHGYSTKGTHRQACIQDSNHEEVQMARRGVRHQAAHRRAISGFV